MSIGRIQLTLFLGEDYSTEIEAIRKQFNPLQYSLIRSHVTLCREEELEHMERIIHNLELRNYPPIIIEFGNAIRFSEGKGVLIPATGSNDQFHNLREKVLDGTTTNPRKHEPHITLMHPRNSVCTDETFSQIEKISLPRKIKFTKVSLIAQEEQAKWNMLKEFPLGREHLK